MAERTCTYVVDPASKERCGAVFDLDVEGVTFLESDGVEEREVCLCAEHVSRGHLPREDWEVFWK